MPSDVGHEAAIIGQVDRCIPGQRLANQTCLCETKMAFDKF